MEEALSVFLSYSRKDLEMLEQLNTHLAGLKRTNKIKTWHDNDIEAGSEWKPEIQERLNTADIIILLISANFIASNYCYCIELQRAIERHDEGEARVIPVILKPCLWNLPDIPFSKLNALPDHARAITQWEDQDEAFANVALRISKSVDDWRKRKLEQQIAYRQAEEQKQLQQIKQQPTGLKTLPSVSLSHPQLNDELFQQVREHCRQKILSQHSRMRLLSGEEISVDQLYVDVWLLNRSPRTFMVSENKLLETFDLRNDRLGLGDRIRRNPGFEVADNHSQIVILGKPGAGKTTFLKHLAVDWCKGKFQVDLLAVLVELRRIKDSQWNLTETIDQELGLGNWQEFKMLKEQIDESERRQTNTPEEQQHKERQIKELQQHLERFPLQFFLQNGKLLVLMDGLDEVPTNQFRKNVEDQLQQFAKEYPDNRLILTCRTQIIGLIPVGFTSVEVADFSEEQVKQFVMNWFMASRTTHVEATKRWEKFDQAVNRNPALKELTATPVLLSLMCLVLQDSGEIPTQRDWLYRKGVKLLLSRWNDTKHIEDWEVGTETYQKLDIKEKEALLIKIAAHKFDNPENFILSQQDEIAIQISQFVGFISLRESIAVLKAIETQHGLLIERADELWSFSHLTFQEYFAFQWLIQLPIEQLAAKLTSQHWNEIIKQIVKSQQPADPLMSLIKQAIDQFLANDPRLQKILTWLFEKSESIQTLYKPVAVRAFYFSLDLARTRILNQDLSLEQSLAFNLDRDLARFLDRVLDQDLALILDFNRPQALDRALVFILDRTFALVLDQARTSSPNHNFLLNLDRTLALVRDSKPSDKLLSDKLTQLKLELTNTSRKPFRRWRQINEEKWIAQLQQVTIEHRNIGHDWQFTEAQKQQLQSYYNANKFLVELMQIEGAVSDDVRAEIEDTLLLPWEELQRRQT